MNTSLTTAPTSVSSAFHADSLEHDLPLFVDTSSLAPSPVSSNSSATFEEPPTERASYTMRSKPEASIGIAIEKLKTATKTCVSRAIDYPNPRSQQKAIIRKYQIDALRAKLLEKLKQEAREDPDKFKNQVLKAMGDLKEHKLINPHYKRSLCTSLNHLTPEGTPMCAHGDDCDYAHGLAEMYAVPLSINAGKGRIEPCFSLFKKNGCSSRSLCRFLHPGDIFCKPTAPFRTDYSLIDNVKNYVVFGVYKENLLTGQSKKEVVESKGEETKEEIKPVTRSRDTVAEFEPSVYDSQQMYSSSQGLSTLSYARPTGTIYYQNPDGSGCFIPAYYKYPDGSDAFIDNGNAAFTPCLPPVEYGRYL